MIAGVMMCAVVVMNTEAHKDYSYSKSASLYPSAIDNVKGVEVSRSLEQSSPRLSGWIPLAVFYKKYACILFVETSGDTSRPGSLFGRNAA
jgi:hypothetical protein